MDMTPTRADDVVRTLLVLLENQERRTDAALEDLDPALLDCDPGNGCNTIRKIVEHLVVLRRFQLVLLESPRASSLEDLDAAADLEQITDALRASAAALRAALLEHDAADWFAFPDPPREGKWGEDPTILRLSRPFNDFVNHLGAIRALRRIFGSAVDRTQ